MHTICEHFSFVSLEFYTIKGQVDSSTQPELSSCVKVDRAPVPSKPTVSVDVKQHFNQPHNDRAQELCESRGGRPGLPVPNNPTVSVDVKQHFNQQTQHNKGITGKINWSKT